MKSYPGNLVSQFLVIVTGMIALLIMSEPFAICSCSAPANVIEAENCKAGNSASEWDISGAGDQSIQGFATDISVNKGDTVHFKIDTDASSYKLDIYRIGYYGGNGARKVATVSPTVSLPQTQPACATDASVKLTDCGNWAESASWIVPSDAVSGVYIAKLIRSDTGGASHIIFVVRDDTGRSDILFKTSDTTWQAYNTYGLGYIEYPDYGWPNQKAKKVSYNRPFLTRAVNNGLGAYNWFFQAEYPMVRWLEANGYNVSYFTSVDTDRRGAELLEHKSFLSVGHDEYWSGQERANVEIARDAGVNLAFFSGNEIYRKIRWENSIDGSGTPYRTMVCYNESNAPNPVDPLAPTIWTGTWRNPTFSPPADGGRPENALSGTLFTVSSGPNELGIAMEVPQANGRLRFWRNTAAASLAAGQRASLGDRVVGYEFDEDIDNGYRPAGLVQLSSTTTAVGAKLLGGNVNIAADVYLPGTATHVSTLYRSASSALVFSAGTVQWSWGLESEHDNGPSVPDSNMRQATVNLFADMGVQPATLQAGLVAATASTDKVAPVSTITSPASGASIVVGTPITITGTAVDSGGGVVGAVEISTDGGTTWHPVAGRESWSYAWTPSASGAAVIRSRAVDDSVNLETPSAGVNLTVTPTAQNTYTIWPGSTVPGLVDGGPDGSVELGVKFRSDSNGYVTGIRFYKASTNTGTHIGNLWSGSGTLLATATFSNESASGWQQVNFATPVAITANTVYVASYHVNNGHYSADVNYFTGKGMDSPPLHALASGVSGSNGVYAYGSTSSFPNLSWSNANYWVDVVVNTTPPATLSSLAVTPSNPTITSGATQQFTATGTYSDATTQNVTSQVTWTSSSTAVATITSAGLATGVAAGSSTISATLSGKSGSATLTVQAAPLSIATTSLPGATLNASYSTTVAASGGTLPYTWSVTSGSLPTGLTLNTTTGIISGTPTTAGTFSFTIQAADSGSPRQTATKALSIAVTAQATYTIWPGSTVPGLVDGGPDGSVELGVKFRSDSNGYVTGIRFYKASTNTGTHIGNLWSSSGTLLATATFSNESASGWQQVNFATPVAITANTVYVASYHVTGGHYSADMNYFTGKGMDSPPLHALASGVSGSNGVYAYGSTSSFPNLSWSNANYWVDVVVSTTPPATLSSLAVTPSNPTITSGATQQFTATGTYSDATTQNVTSQVTWTSSSTAVATITSAGLATGVAAGSSTISATLSGKSGSTTLGVVAPLVISTSTLPGGTINVAYNSTLAASGGLLPYGWSVTTGSLPTGLTLNTTTGTISGTPTATGTFSFTVQAADSGSLRQTAAKSLSIVVILPDTTPPSVSVVVPTNGSTGTSIGTNLTAVFSEDLSTSSINSATFQLRSSSGTLISATATYDGSTFIATLDPASALEYLTTYTATIKGGSSGVKDQAGNSMTTDFSWSFTTGDPPTAITTPILLLSSAANPFSGYYAEILRTEGVTSFDVADVSAVTSSLLNSHDVVLLGEMSLTSSQATMLTDWVNAGGKLIAMRPDKKLAALLGLTDRGMTLSNGYVLVDASSGPGLGIVNQTVQYHGTADRFTLNGATALATLYSAANTATSDPAVTLKAVGTKGGQAAAFTYDLARSVVYTRQGNPVWAGQDRDGISPKRSDDLFFGDASFDPQPDWIDMDKVAIPQADEQQRLLVNMIIRMNMDNRPIPRFWYLPRSLAAAVVMTGDDHGNNGTSGRFDSFISQSPVGCSVDNWECIRGTSYIFPNTPISATQAARYANAGFEIGAHVSSNCEDWTPATLETFFVHDLGDWSETFHDLPLPDTSRMHCVVWSDYSTMPVVELNHGIRFDTNYYYWPSGWVSNRPGMHTGSGMPMRFANASGNIIDVYQATTQMTDESGQSYPYTIDTLLDRALGPEGYYGVFTANIHTDTAESAEAEAIVDSAIAHGIPVVSARQMLTWLDGRNSSSFSAISWNGTKLGFTITAAQGATGLTAMVPVPAGMKVVEATKDGGAITFTTAMIKGINYAQFAATSGSYQVGFAYDTSPPVVSNVTPVNSATAIATGTKVVAVFSEALDPATVSSATFELRDPTNNTVPATVSYNPVNMTMTLTPSSVLTNAMTYTAVVKGGTYGVKDLAGNPLASNYAWSFTTLASAGAYTLWPSTAAPLVADAGPDSPVELGVKFRSDISGFITGIRFYKASTNTGIHVANLWTSGGTRLATATFSDETASGWQQVNFSNPVSIAANTVYVASYHTNTGHYSSDLNYFRSKGTDNPPLHAPADGVSGINGVYAYGSGSNFPVSGWLSSNYWVDVVFHP